jgi:spore maturation protein CgeB
VIVARSGADVAERLGHLSHREARQMGLAAQRRILAQHTYSHRAAQVEALLDATRPTAGGIAG